MSDTTVTDDLGDVEDFDAFWQTTDRKGPRVRIMGDIIELPVALPLAFEMEARRLQRSKSGDDVQRLLTMLGFSEDRMNTWRDRGMDVEQFQVLLAWAPQRISGANVTLAEVREQVREQATKAAARAEGKGQKRR